MVLTRVRLFLTVGFLALLHASALHAQALPPDLQRDADARECKPIAVDSASRADRETDLPLFLAGNERTGESPMYWCTRAGHEAESFLIVLRPPAGCPVEIPYVNGPGGLSLGPSHPVHLADYASTMLDAKAPPVVAKSISIRAESGGTESVFVCHAGKWYFVLYH